MGPALIEGIERTNAVVVRGSGQGVGIPPRQDPYTMEIDRERNCYTCRGFGHMAHHCRNRGQWERVAEKRRLEYGRGGIEGNFEHSDNLKGVVSRSLTIDLTFIFISHFSFSFSFFSFIFLFLEQLRLGVISHAVTSVTT